MDTNFITMLKVDARRKALQESGRGKRAKITSKDIRMVRDNLNENTLRNFIRENCNNIYDINNNIITILEMINDIEASDTYKKNTMEYLKTNGMLKVHSDGVEKANEFISSNGMIPYSATMDAVFRDYSIMDRILHNDESLGNRFNFDKVIKNNSNGDVESIVGELCSLIDTYTLSKEAKMNIALENIQYSLYKNGIRESQENIVEYITNYFLFNEQVMTDKDYNGIKKVLKNNRTISESCIDRIGFVLEKTENQFADKIKKLSERCDDNSIGKFILKVNNIKNENMASTYIADGIEKANAISTSQKDAKNILTSIHMIPLLGYVSKSFIISELKLHDMKTKTKNKIEDKEFIDAINALFEDEYELGLEANLCESYIKEDEEKYDFNSIDLFGETLLESEDFADSSDVKKVVDQFKSDQNKSIGKCKSYLLRIYQKSPENIIDETPHILGMIRMAFIIGLTAVPTVGPALALVTAFVDKMVSMKINDKQTGKLITALENEKKEVKEKISKGKGNKSELESYVKCLDKCIEKVDNYRYSITDDEVEGRPSSDDDDDDFDFSDDLDFSFEQMLLADMNVLNTIQEAVNDVQLHNDVEDFIGRATKEGGSFLGDILSVIDQAKVFDIQSIYDKYAPTKYTKMTVRESTSFGAGFDKLNRYIPYTVNESCNKIDNEVRGYEFDNGLYIEACAIECVRDIVTEGSAINTIKLAVQNFKKKAKDLSTKEKSMWQSLDATMSGLTKAIERSLTSNRREALIKGSIIPSFSKCVKMGLTVGAVSLLNPVFGVITAIGMYGTSKALNHKERQLIYDEIETELKVVDKELQMADNDGDIKRYRFLLQYQKKLERERQRIKYGMKVHGRDIPSSSAGRGEY